MFESRGGNRRRIQSHCGLEKPREGASLGSLCARSRDLGVARNGAGVDRMKEMAFSRDTTVVREHPMAMFGEKRGEVAGIRGAHTLKGLIR